MIAYAAVSERGSRSINEDSIAVRKGEKGLLAVLADGLGGHGAGEVASALAVKACLAVFEDAGVPDASLLASCAARAQETLLQEQRRQNRPGDIKTTLTLLHIAGDVARWAHVGDSRVYHFSGSHLAGRTLDHSVPQMLVAQGQIRERDIRHHEDRNRLTRVLGMEWESPRYELSPEVMLAPPASFLLCSDGFWELVDEKEISRQLKKALTPDDWLASLKAAVQRNGRGKNMDNYSAIAVFAR